MKNPEPANSYNLVVIGAGTAGLVTAAGTAGIAAKVALVERNLMGGDCLNVDCVPSKALISAASAETAVRKAVNFGIDDSSGSRVKFVRVIERTRLTPFVNKLFVKWLAWTRCPAERVVSRERRMV